MLDSSRKKVLSTLVALAGALAVSGPAQAEEDRGYPSLAVQNRQYFGHHELGLAVGVLPMDAFTKGITVSGSYTVHFDETFGWEIVQLFHAFPVDSGLTDELAAFDLQPTPFETLETYAMTNFVFKPIYWKGAVLNDALARGEIMFLVGGGVGWFSRSTRGGADAGMALRLYFSELISTRLDVRWMGFLTDKGGSVDLHNELWIGLGLAFTL